MPHNLLQATVVASLFAAGVCAYLALTATEEALVALTPVCDFGDLRQGDTVDAAFQLVNNHREPVEIKFVSEPCGCMDIKLTKTALAPKETTVLSARWKVERRRGPVRLEVPVVYARNGHALAQTSVYLQARVIPDFTYNPEYLVFTGNEKATKEVFITQKTDPISLLLRAYCTHGAFQATLHADQRRVLVLFDPVLQCDDQLSAYLVVETSSSREPRLVIRLLAQQRQEE